MALLLGGCGSRDEDACDYVRCAIDEASCVERVAEAVGCHLGQDVIYPEVRFVTADEFVAEIEASADPLTAEEQRDRDDYLRVQALLGLMPEGYAPEELNADWIRNVAALYSPEDKGIVIIADHVSGEPESDFLVLVHEMVHAYQDAAWDLTALVDAHASTYDRFLGLRALIEGDAVAYQNLAQVELAGYAPHDIDWAGFFADWQDDRLQRAAETETPALDTTILFPYAFGGGLVMGAWLDGGSPVIDALSQRPPDSVRQVLGGYAAWPEQFVNEDALLDEQALAVMPPNYEALFGDHEGVWVLNAMVQRTAAGELWTAPLYDVSADYLTTWRWNDADVVAMWRIRSASPDDLVVALTRLGARWVPAGAADVPATHIVAKVDGDVLLIAVSGGDARTVLADIAGWQSIAEAAMVRKTGGSRLAGARDRRRIGCAPPRRPAGG